MCFECKKVFIDPQIWWGNSDTGEVLCDNCYKKMRSQC